MTFFKCRDIKYFLRREDKTLPYLKKLLTNSLLKSPLAKQLMLRTVLLLFLTSLLIYQSIDILYLNIKRQEVEENRKTIEEINLREEKRESLFKQYQHLLESGVLFPLQGVKAKEVISLSFGTKYVYVTSVHFEIDSEYFPEKEFWQKYGQLQLEGISYESATTWTVWINGEELKPGIQHPFIILKKVTPASCGGILKTSLRIKKFELAF